MEAALLKDAILMKCETRSQQLTLVIGLGLFIVALVGLGRWMLMIGGGMYEAVKDHGSDVGVRGGSNMASSAMFFYGGAAICGFLSVLFGLMLIVNLVRLVTNTGLKEPDVW